MTDEALDFGPGWIVSTDAETGTITAEDRITTNSVDIGDLPDGTRVELVVRRSPSLMVRIGTARRGALVVRTNQNLALSVEGYIAIIELRSKASQRSISITTSHTPRRLVANAPRVEMRTEQRSKKFVVEVPEQSSPPVQLGGEICSVIGAGDVMWSANADDVDRPTVATEGHFKTDRVAEFESVRCGQLTAGADLTSDEIDASRNVVANGSLSARTVHAGGSITVAKAFAVGNVTTQGRVVVGKVGAVNTGDDTPRHDPDTLAVDVPPRQVAGTLTVHGTVQANELYCGTLKLSGSNASVQATTAVGADRVTADPAAPGTAGLSSRLVAVKNIDHAQLAITADHVHLLDSSTFEALTCTTLLAQSGEISTTTGRVCAEHVITSASNLTAPLRTRQLDIGEGALVSDRTEVSNAIKVGRDARIEQLVLLRDPDEANTDTITVRSEGTIDALECSDVNARLSLKADGHVASITTRSGSLTIDTPLTGRNDATITIDHLTLTDHEPKVSFERGDEPVHVQHLDTVHAHEAHITIGDLDEPRGPVKLSLDDADRTRLKLTSNDSTHIHAHGGDAEIDYLDIDGLGSVTLAANVDRLHCANADIRLNVVEECAVNAASGRFRLADLAGRFQADPNSTTTPRVDSLQNAAPTAHLTGVDITNMPPESLAALGDMYALRIDAASIRPVATTPGLSRSEIEQRAQWMFDLQRVLEEKATEGTLASAVGWATGRLAQRRTPLGGEWFGRALHRLVGYGYKLWPPLLTWVLVAAAWTTLSIDEDLTDGTRLPGTCTYEPIDTVARCAETWPDVARQYVLTLLFPGRLFRLSDPRNLFAYLPDWCQPIAGITVGLPFLFFLFALRRRLQIATN